MYLYAFWAVMVAYAPALVSAASCAPQGPEVTAMNGAAEVYVTIRGEIARNIYADPEIDATVAVFQYFTVLDLDNPIY